MRSFNPVELGGHEADAWVSYYQRRWGKFLRASLGLVREGFGLPWPATLRGAWYVMRANQAWAPYPHNEPALARRYMRQFYALVTRHNGETFDVEKAAELEVEWWRIHRYLQRESSLTVDDLTAALAALYAHVYGVPADRVSQAARHRADAMVISDRWVAAGAASASPDIAAERDELIRGYSLLRAAIR